MCENQKYASPMSAAHTLQLITIADQLIMI